jgi:hypothetical protein
MPAFAEIIFDNHLCVFFALQKNEEGGLFETDLAHLSIFVVTLTGTMFAFKYFANELVKSRAFQNADSLVSSCCSKPRVSAKWFSQPANSSMESIKELRRRTQAGYMDCKNALNETSGDVEKAIEILKKKGALKAAAKADRVAAEGLIAVATSLDRGVMIEVMCQHLLA